MAPFLERIDLSFSLSTITWIGLLCRLDLCEYFVWSTFSPTPYPTNLSEWVGSIKVLLDICLVDHIISGANWKNEDQNQANLSEILTAHFDLKFVFEWFANLNFHNAYIQISFNCDLANMNRFSSNHILKEIRRTAITKSNSFIEIFLDYES